MSTFVIGQRVSTPFGLGEIINFEFAIVGAKIIYGETYVDSLSCRIGVNLDFPELWGCNSVTSGIPYFTKNDLETV